jgi:hypothetical protein
MLEQLIRNIPALLSRGADLTSSAGTMTMNVLNARRTVRTRQDARNDWQRG